MKKLLTLLALFSISLLFAEVCWDNGIPVYEGNNIYNTRSCRTSSDNIFMAWSEATGSGREIFLHKSNSNGELIWQTPISITQSENHEYLAQLISSHDDGCYIEIRYNAGAGIVYKVNTDGNITWQSNISSYYFTKFIVDDSGDLIALSYSSEHTNHIIKATRWDETGNIIWDEIDLYSVDPDITCTIARIDKIDNELVLVLRMDTNLQVFRFDETGTMISESELYPWYNSYSVKRVNDRYYFFTNDFEAHVLKLVITDLSGNNVSGETPLEIAEIIEWNGFNNFLAGDDHIMCFKDYDTQLEIIKIDLNGNLIDSFNLATYDNGNIFASDQERNFFILSSFVNNEYISELYYLDSDGPSEAIAMQDGEYGLYDYQSLYYLNNGLTAASMVSNEHSQKIATYRNTGTDIQINEIKNITDDLIYPYMISQPDGMAVYWFSRDNNAIMKQVYDDEGNPLYPANGEILVTGYDEFVISNNVIYCYNFEHNEEIIYLEIVAYNLSGEAIWSEPVLITDLDMFSWHITANEFQDGIIISNSLSYPDYLIQMFYLDSSGLVWDNPLEIDFGAVSTSDYIFKGDNLFYSQDDCIYYTLINSDGSYSEPTILDSNSDRLRIYGNSEKYLTVTRATSSTDREIQFFIDQQEAWNQPVIESFIGYSGFNPVFTDSGVYLTGYDYPNTINVKMFDNNANHYPIYSFDFNSASERVRHLKPEYFSDKLLFFIASELNYSDTQFSYTIYDKLGNVLLPEFAESVLVRPNMENIHDVLIEDDAAYLLLSCGFKPFEGEYERSFYIQKIDLSQYTGFGSEEVPEQKLLNFTNYPNPFNPTTTISFSLNRELTETTKIEIYNVKGQKVVTLKGIEQDSKLAKCSVAWNGTDRDKKQVSSGLYLAKLIDGDKSLATKKMMLLK